MSGNLLSVVAAVLVVGIGVQLIARRLRVPSVVFYLVAGVLLGPEVLGVVTLETFGDGLVTIGAVVMFLATTLTVRLLTETTWEIALLVGALLVATGPTVITPILEVVRVREHVAAALETEGIVNDVTAAIGAVVIFETLLLDDLGVPATVLRFSSGSGSASLQGWSRPSASIGSPGRSGCFWRQSVHGGSSPQASRRCSRSSSN